MSINKVFTIFLISIVLGGCTAKVHTVPQKFPEVPKELLEPCKKLTLADEKNPKLSNLLETIVENYQNYEECSIKHDLFVDWYNKQKEIHNKK